MEHLEGRQSVLAALAARQRKIQLVLVHQGAHDEKVREVLEAAAAAGVPVRRVERRELDALAHGATHGGIIAVASPKPRTNFEELSRLLDALTEPPLLLLIEGLDDA